MEPSYEIIDSKPLADRFDRAVVGVRFPVSKVFLDASRERNGSWRTIATCFLNEDRVTSLTFMPSMRMRPSLTSYILDSRLMIEVLPAPVWPTRAIVSPASTSRSNPLMT